MKRKRKIAIVLMLCVCFTELNFAPRAKASEILDAGESMEEKFSEMSIDDLNLYIDNIAKKFSDSEIQTFSADSNAIQNAWLAAAEIARKQGYPCAAAMVRCSVNNTAYTESSIGPTGLCSAKIVNTSAFKTVLKNAKEKKKDNYSTSAIFTKSMDSDLFYALHNVDVTSTRLGSGAWTTYTMKVTDTFDFAYDNNYDSLFTSCVNNWAWLCQQAHYLHKIKITITFDVQ